MGRLFGCLRLFAVVCAVLLGSVPCFAGAFKLEIGMTKHQVKNALGVYYL